MRGPRAPGRRRVRPGVETRHGARAEPVENLSTLPRPSVDTLARACRHVSTQVPAWQVRPSAERTLRARKQHAGDLLASRFGPGPSPAGGTCLNFVYAPCSHRGVSTQASRRSAEPSGGGPQRDATHAAGPGHDVAANAPFALTAPNAHVMTGKLLCRDRTSVTIGRPRGRSCSPTVWGRTPTWGWVGPAPSRMSSRVGSAGTPNPAGMASVRPRSHRNG